MVVNFTGAQMSGLKDETGSEAWSLFYPYKEGKLYDGVISRINEGLGVGTKMTAAYPSPMSMQLLQLYNGNASFDYSVLDSEGVYKDSRGTRTMIPTARWEIRSACPARSFLM